MLLLLLLMMQLNLVIYPSGKELTFNEQMFARRYKKLNFIFIGDDYAQDLSKIISKSIKSIVILLDNYGHYIEKNIDIITSSKHIRFFIHENNIHYLKSKSKSYDRLLKLRKQLIDNDHIYILSYYWYHYNKLYNVRSNNLICFPNFVFKKEIPTFNYNIFLRIFLHGNISKYHPMRKYLKKMKHDKVDMLSENTEYDRLDVINELNKYVCGFTCCMNRDMPYIGKEFFEICGSGALLLAYDEYVKEPLRNIGFLDGENYISCSKDTILEKIEYIIDRKNLREINRIRKNGYELVKKNHTNINRYNLLYRLTNFISI